MLDQVERSRIAREVAIAEQPGGMLDDYNRKSLRQAQDEIAGAKLLAEARHERRVLGICDDSAKWVRESRALANQEIAMARSKAMAAHEQRVCDARATLERK